MREGLNGSRSRALSLQLVQNREELSRAVNYPIVSPGRNWTETEPITTRLSDFYLIRKGHPLNISIEWIPAGKIRGGKWESSSSLACPPKKGYSIEKRHCL